MKIDWFTLVAEIVNFLVLVALLKHFLYDRIIQVADEREAKIAARFEEAEGEKEEAQQEAESYRAKRQELEDEREELLSEAREEAEARRKELLREARSEVEETQARWYETIRQEKELFLHDLRLRAGQQIHNIARRALADLADAELEQRILESFMERLQGLEEKEREAIAESVQKSDGEVVIYSTFELPKKTRRDLLEFMQDQWGDDLKGQFETSPDLVAGIELKADGYQIGWSLRDYLSSLEEALAHVLEEELSKRRAQAEGKSDEK